ncbi:uncharacterized protein LAJ45_00880 [Morchella importuna]|uniref:uncharacterized protein n=1 Tax=Morchella importuna TaxID=1174673 RepID=UPI001E8ECE04|nr:uncharacterized protein LAJ45_00880 [Morchella importuna]KAH8155868.1 hypothetical protein LAJ45_00880 [Morchella importuna]
MSQHSRGFVALNVIRGFSVVALCMAIIAAITHLVKSFIQSKYFLFDVLNNLILALFCLFLLISETPLLSTYYKRRWPLFGPDSSLVSIGVAEVIVGFQLLGMVNDQPHEHGEKEDKPAVIISFDKILIASGALVCATGAINYVFCNSQTHTTARTIRAFSKKAKETRKPATLDRVTVDGEPSIERPQRTFSKASRVAPAGHELEREPSVQNVEMVSRRPSVASSGRGAFPYTTAFTPPPPPPPPNEENRTSWVEGSEEAFSQSQYTEVRPTPPPPTPAKYGAHGNPYGSSEAGESSYSSKPSPSEYKVKGNPYTRIAD